MVNILVVAFVALGGVLATVQSGANAQLVRSLGRPFSAALCVSLVTVVCFVAALPLVRETLPTGERIASAPWWAWVGGICGAVYVTGTLLFAERLGAGMFTGVTVTAGIVTSLLLDHFGWVGFQPHEANAWRLLGGLLMVAGVVLVAVF